MFSWKTHSKFAFTGSWGLDADTPNEYGVVAQNFQILRFKGISKVRRDDTESLQPKIGVILLILHQSCSWNAFLHRTNYATGSDGRSAVLQSPWSWNSRGKQSMDERKSHHDTHQHIRGCPNETMEHYLSPRYAIPIHSCTKPSKSATQLLW
jgi:hypothetical protein